MASSDQFIVCPSPFKRHGAGSHRKRKSLAMLMAMPYSLLYGLKPVRMTRLPHFVRMSQYLWRPLVIQLPNNSRAAAPLPIRNPLLLHRLSLGTAIVILLSPGAATGPLG